MARLTRSLLLASAVPAALSIAVEHPTLAQEPSPMYVVTYFEVAPAMSTEARALLKAFRDASRKEEGSAQPPLRPAPPGQSGQPHDHRRGLGGPQGFRRPHRGPAREEVPRSSGPDERQPLRRAPVRADRLGEDPQGPSLLIGGAASGG